MLLAAVRGYASCEVLAVSNRLLRRDDQIGCALFWPIDHGETNRQHHAQPPAGLLGERLPHARQGLRPRQ
jgi:hypothetical protein